MKGHPHFLAGGQLDAARCVGFRQAAPFSKGAPTATPRPPGRRAGAHGRRGRRAIPRPVDVRYTVPLPQQCPHCGDRLVATRTATQYQEDTPAVQPVVRTFAVTVGRCVGCGWRVQGRHPLQTSDASGRPRRRWGGGCQSGGDAPYGVWTLYAIQPAGFEGAASVLGAAFDGCLIRDGWMPYRQFTGAVHQTCLVNETSA